MNCYNHHITGKIPLITLQSSKYHYNAVTHTADIIIVIISDEVCQNYGYSFLFLSPPMQLAQKVLKADFHGCILKG